MGYKKTDPCLQGAWSDERIFVLLTRDITAPQVVMEWVKLNYNTQPKEQIQEAIDCAIEMRSKREHFVSRNAAVKGLNKASLSFSDEQGDLAREVFDRMVASKKVETAYFVRSHHWATEGYWIEFRKPKKKDLQGFVLGIIEDFKLLQKGNSKRRTKTK